MNKEQIRLVDARYESPCIEVIEVSVEKGFQGSIEGFDGSIEGFEELEEEW